VDLICSFNWDKRTGAFAKAQSKKNTITASVSQVLIQKIRAGAKKATLKRRAWTAGAVLSFTLACQGTSF
jgi:hypothetical protein